MVGHIEGNTDIGREKIDNSTDLQQTYREVHNLLQNEDTSKRFSRNFGNRLEGNIHIRNLLHNSWEIKSAHVDVKQKVEQVHDAVQTLLSSDIPSGVPVMWTPEYQQLRNKITTLYNNITEWAPEDISRYGTGTVYENWNVKIITMQDPMDFSKNIKITFNKAQNRFTVTKDGNFVASRGYM